MRTGLVLAIAVSVLLAFGVACGGDEKEPRVAPSPASESEGESEEWEAEEEEAEEGEDEGEPSPLFFRDSDDDNFADAAEEDLGSDPLDDASVPEHATVPDSCTDGVDNDGDTDIDDADDGCP